VLEKAPEKNKAHEENHEILSSHSTLITLNPSLFATSNPVRHEEVEILETCEKFKKSEIC